MSYSSGGNCAGDKQHAVNEMMSTHSTLSLSCLPLEGAGAPTFSLGGEGGFESSAVGGGGFLGRGEMDACSPMELLTLDDLGLGLTGDQGLAGDRGALALLSGTVAL